ncbi:hypothetical protein DLAC_10827 [Tieghemostelium lacteum]|uniref:Uncharacterized protein n=1 Tax=Tieghemostelium lacteum TaxID=361077 RepID=A0A151Z3V8_TIELA|nr:hypothetical protein DLAC_10827 [Tieghemostelium lacteum]|eukprot:KYQ88653.1 hypothetical protein DLAC_10827 [Tieghemostelium lacteum]
MGKASPVLHSKAALQDAYQSSGMISSFGGPNMQTSLGGQQGEGLRDWLKKANSYLKDKKIISTVAKALDKAGVPIAGTVGDVAQKYGRKRGKSKKFVDLLNEYEDIDIAEIDELTVTDQLILENNTNQIVFGDDPNQVTLNVYTSFKSTINIPSTAPHLVADVVLTETDQSINGVKKFNDTLIAEDIVTMTTNSTISITTPSLNVTNNGTIDTLTTDTINSTTSITTPSLNATNGDIDSLDSDTINATTSITTPSLIVNNNITAPNVSATTVLSGPLLNVDTINSLTPFPSPVSINIGGLVNTGSIYSYGSVLGQSLVANGLGATINGQLTYEDSVGRNIDLTQYPPTPTPSGQ